MIKSHPEPSARPLPAGRRSEGSTQRSISTNLTPRNVALLRYTWQEALPPQEQELLRMSSAAELRNQILSI